MSAIGIYIALGANLGDRHATIAAALRDLSATGDIAIRRVSAFIESEPVGGPAGQPRYLNAVAALETRLSPPALLARLQAVEAKHGRTRDVCNGPRTLDLDLLLYHDERLSTADLIVPHPRMAGRAFVMAPLAEICPPAEYAAIQEFLECTAGDGVRSARRA